MKRPDFRLYLITDKRLSPAGNIIAAIKAALDAGCRAVALREKDMGGGELFRLAERLKVLTSDYGARLFINDRIDVALGVDADGVHLGQAGFSPKDARRLLGRKKLIGVSTHSVLEAIKAQKDGADFITLGPIYPTPSKAEYGRPVGLGVLKKATGRLEIPIFAIGGVKKERIKEVTEGGAYGVALISAIIKSPDIKTVGKRTAEILKELDMITKIPLPKGEKRGIA
ncbi:MAG: thiamine phosphate synthase [Deltaproteobacteria bacterium]|nr:thiamine phosphate synthase [Deltaproteobacteria bacterium]